ncbi:MAG TPA: lipopolysaccharide biosynthesis protein [Steroidobacteraceae bacterium]|nr:lipopolysaccharide biosynthesis protein [Steroidobacteraceae bacterium]
MNVSGSIARGATLMVLFKLVERGLGFISTLILARLLVPGDFGLVAMATSFITLIELMGAFGFDISLIRLERAERVHYDTAWTLNVAVGTLLAICMLGAAVPLSHFYGEARLPPVIFILACGSIATAFENIGVVEFRRKLEFGREFRFQIAKKVAAFMITVPLAFTLRNHWALVAGMLTSRIASTTWSYYVHPYRPRFSLGAARELIGFSKWLLLNNFLFFFKERGSDFIIGRLAGRSALGLYNVGYEIANLPTTELVAPINRAAFPGYAKVAADAEGLRKGFLDVIAVVTLFAIPAGIGLAAVAPIACQVLLGPNWLGAIPIIEIVAIQGAITALQSNGFAVYLALGRADLATRITAGYVIMLLPLSAALTASKGITGAAIACLVTAAVFAPVNYFVLLRKLDLPVSRFLAVIWRPASAACVMFYATRAVTALLAPVVPGLIALLLSVACGAIVYIACVALCWRLAGSPAGSERAVIERAKSLLAKRRPAASG